MKYDVKRTKMKYNVKRTKIIINVQKGSKMVFFGQNLAIYMMLNVKNDLFNREI